jgi:predicted Zn-dependent protease
MLMRVRNSDILGVVLAHEIGHVFGQRHTNTGIMRRSYTRAEWEAFVTGRLIFSTSQARGLRAAVTPIHEREIATGRQ